MSATHAHGASLDPLAFPLRGRHLIEVSADSARKRRKLSWSKWAVAFSHYLDHLNLLFSPDLIVLGGGISKQFNQWGKVLKTQVPVQPATLENNAGIIGAAALWRPDMDELK